MSHPDQIKDIASIYSLSLLHYYLSLIIKENRIKHKHIFTP
ncbi:hypothetical protein EUBHAL_01211 [Anaerobutyricum hallii DSM 3353]|uniref:Uncharacterized protein n=1 Tax=Anaerobutyricum hallii DSM 3353 TaxID=411469 RepID=C0EUX2_9FIRM|nr:hypothetical protein EUBHAL_01211 [Anaerobutyricum hallii DSM 3353]